MGNQTGGGGGGSGAPKTAKYLLQTADARLANAQAMGALATGFAYVTTSTGVISTVGETGSGNVVRATSPTIVTPTIASFTNATHDHTNAAGGGNLSATVVTSGTLALARGGTNADLSATGAANSFLKQSSSGAAVTVGTIASADIATALTTPGAIGGTTPNTGQFTTLYVGATGGPVATELTVINTSAADPRGILSGQYSNDALGSRIHLRKARGTPAVPTTITTGDVLGRIRFSGYDGANFLQMGSIDVVSTGTVASTRVPTYMAFSVATDAAPSALAERMRIDSAGNVGIRVTPSYPLDIRASAAASNPVAFISNTGGGNYALTIDNSGSGNANFSLAIGGVSKATIGFNRSSNFIGFLNEVYSSNNFNLQINSDGSFSYHDGANGTQVFKVTKDGLVTITGKGALTSSVSYDLSQLTTSGTVAAGLGKGTQYYAVTTANGTQRQLVDIAGLFKVSTDASYEGYGLIRGWYMASGTPTARNTIGWGADGTGSRVGFHSVASAPILRPANANEAAVVTTAATQTTPYGFSTQAQADAIVTLVNALRQCLVDYDLWKGAA